MRLYHLLNRGHGRRRGRSWQMKILVHHDQGLPLPLQLVPEAGPEVSEAGVHHLPQSEDSGHLYHIGILHTHGVPGVGYPPALLVDEVLPLVGDVLVHPPDFLQLLLIVPGALLHPGQPPLEFSQLLHRAPHPMGRGGRKAVAVDIKMGQGVVQTQGGLCRGDNRSGPLRRVLIYQRAVIFAGWGPAHCGALELPPVQWLPVQPGPHHPCLGEADAAVGQYNAGALPGGIGLTVHGKAVAPPFFPLIDGVPIGSGVVKEMLERPAEALVNLGQSAAVYLFQERGLRLVAGRRWNEVYVGLLIKLLLIGEHVVPQPATAAEGFFKQLRLPGRGGETHLDGGILHRSFIRCLSHPSAHRPP